MENTLEIFYQRFKKGEDARIPSPAAVADLERELGIIFPTDYKSFILKYGDVWTPGILDILSDKKLGMPDIEEFWDTEDIAEDKRSGWTAHHPGLILFASNCMGNIFCFEKSEIEIQQPTAGIYFYDQYYDTVSKLSDSFTSWLQQYNEI